MNAEQTTQILKAGGLVPLKAKVAKDDAVDTVVARAYTHPILGSRVVIRLTAENVTQGDDLEMATLGFGPGADRGQVAKERRRPLGFPGWALVHDPKNARFALDVVDELKKQVRKAKSKPGHAKDGIDAIAAKLAKSVPHFLPSFYEEAGRGLIEHGAISQAAIFFGKAREAEAVHALEVDEQARVDGFLEFALAGAVTTKALSQYAKDLAAHHEPKVAYAHFRQLCLQRTLGGMPPWSGMATELRRLAKAAKLDIKREDAQFVSEIIESPALAKAAGDFWRTYEEPIIALGKESAKVRGLLLNMFPTGSTYKPDLDEAWLDILEACGAIEALVRDDVPAESKPAGTRAAWFDRLTAHLARDYRNNVVPERAFHLLRRMAPQLVADGAAISARGRWGNHLDLDLAELALSLGVPLTMPPHGAIDLQGWAGQTERPERGVDPVRVAAHPETGPALAAAVGKTIGTEPFDSASRGKQGFLAAKRAFVEGLLVRAERGALPELDEATATLQSKVKAETFAELPDLHERLKALDVAPALARTLRFGLVDELGYPALEAVEKEIDPDGTVPWTIHGGLPALVVVTKTKAIAVGPTGKLGEHDLVVPPKHEFATARFIDGEFLVLLKEGYSTIKAYWSSAPLDLFTVETVSYYSLPALVGRAAVLPDGAWNESGVPIRRGDRKITLGGFAACDGTTTWIQEWKDNKHRWIEVAPTGEHGRASWPSWIEAGIESGWAIDTTSSYLVPAPTGLTASPFGIADGMLGIRARYRPEPPHGREVQTIDGIVHTGTGFASLVRLPGDAIRPLQEESAWREGVTTTILDEAGALRGSIISNKERRYAKGQAVPLPPIFWHLFTPRDEAGSRRLHAVTDDDARALIAAIPVQTTEPPGVTHPLPANVTGSVLPEITHPRLRAGIEGVTVLAVELDLRRDKLVTERAPGAVKAAVVEAAGPNDATLLGALQPFTGRSWGQDGSAWTQIQQTADVFASEDRSNRVATSPSTPTRVDWFPFATMRWALAFMGTALGTPIAGRRALADLLVLFVERFPPPEKLRIYAADAPATSTTARSAFELRWHDGNAYAIRRVGYYGTNYAVLQYAPDGNFKELPELSSKAPGASAKGPTLEEAQALRAAVAEGKTSWSESAAQKLAELTGLTPSEAAFFWAGCPNAHDSSANFLDKALREQLGLKSAQAQLARDAINAIPWPKRLVLIYAAGSAGVPALLDGSAVDTLAKAWIELFGKRVPIPEDVLAEADKEINVTTKPAQALAIYASGGDDPRLTTDGTWGLLADGTVARVSQPAPLVGQTRDESAPPAFDVSLLYMHCAYAPFLYAALPVGHELRAKVPQVHARILERLQSPHLWLDAGNRYDATAIDTALEALGGEPLAGFTEPLVGRRHGAAVTVKSQYRVELKLHASTLASKTALTKQLVDLISPYGNSLWDALTYATGDDLAAIVARIEQTPVPAGGWEQDARASAPEIVDAVAKKYKLSADAAGLYLQYLVLLSPTAKRLLEWNGWKTKQLDAAHGELEGKELILEAKRERAGRSYFLPGSWEANKSPHPPFETWKLPFYTIEGGTQGRRTLGNRYAATAPFHVLYERAWARLQSGDVPRYEEVKRS